MIWLPLAARRAPLWLPLASAEERGSGGEDSRGALRIALRMDRHRGPYITRHAPLWMEGVRPMHVAPHTSPWAMTPAPVRSLVGRLARALERHGGYELGA